ncbi:hypothetical protein PR048_020307 [Dryococelus australis]|uniref:NACHT domain-containing protein n=1 Tax=Dryococelus australis TaxID=614101 RepID=A0ABQ9H5Z3_9NEOP|nr:hypothetical protein PR048_020307 [Dryococelus australis]
MKGFPAATCRCPSSLDMILNETLRWSGVGMQELVKREYPKKTRRQAATSSTIPTCENPGVNPPEPAHRLLFQELGEVRRAEYTRTGGQCSTSGAMYEVKVSALLYLRATVREWDFRLGTNVEEAGKFDDVRLTYVTDRGPRQILVQLRHKESRSISKAQLLADDRKKSKFSLLLYYKSFRDLRDSFGSNAVLNRHSRFKDIEFVLFSNAEAEVSGGLFTDDDLVTTFDSVLNMGGKVFNFAHNEDFTQEFKNKYAGDVNDEVVMEFFDQFYIYSDQTREENLQKQIKDEIKTSYSISEYGVNKVSTSLIEYIQSWWKNRTETRHLKLGDFQFEPGLDILKEFNAESPKLEFKPKEISRIKVNFQGSNVRLCTILGENFKDAIDAHLLSLLTYRDKVIQLGFLQGRKQPFYIDRVLICKNFLKKSVLRRSSRNVFAVSGLSAEQVETFLDMVESSSDNENITSPPDFKNVLTYEHIFCTKNMTNWYADGTVVDSTLTASYPLLSNIFGQLNKAIHLEQINRPQSQNCGEINTTKISSEPLFQIIESFKEFSELCTRYKEENVHWLEVRDGKLKWKQSKGNWNVIQRNISAQKDYISVTNVWDIPDRIVVFSGDSGMGKSSLLSQIAVNSKEERPETCIILIDLSECESDLKNLDLKITPDKACEFIVRNSMSFEGSCQSSFKYFFEYILRHTERAVLLVDGFGEVCPQNECKIVNLIQSFVKLRLSKLWITSRSHMASRLERITRTICFELQPLKISEGLELVRRCRCDEEHGTVSGQEMVMDHRGCQLLENPLHCKMIAEAARINTRVRGMLLGKETSNIFVISTLTIFEDITKVMFENYFGKYHNSLSENNQMRETLEKNKQFEQFIEYHEWSAVLHMVSLGIIKYSQWFSKEDVTLRLKAFIDAVKSGSRVTGMINTVRDGIPQFEHKMYEEYFLALWMGNNCRGYFQNATKIILQRIIFDPRFSFVINIFNQMASKEMKLHNYILQNYWNSPYLLKILPSIKKSEVNAKDKAGRTALHLALSIWSNSIGNCLLCFFPEKQKEVIGKLLRLGAKPDIKDDILKWSPFKYSNIRITPWSIVAMMMKEKRITKSDMNELVERVETQKQDALAGLAHAVSFGNTRLVSFLLDNGVDVNDRIDEMGDTAIIIAAAHGQHETLEFLHIKRGARPELTNHNGDSPLHWACLSGHMTIVKYLVNKCKISADIKNNTDYTPLLAAARGGHLKIVQYLRDKHSSDPQGRTKLGQSALCLAAGGTAGDDIGVVKYLVEECGLNPQECECGCLPAITACANGNLRITRYFVDKCGVDPSETKNGICLLHVMIISLNVEQMKELVRCCKLSLDITDNTGRTLFMQALVVPKHDMCEYLQRKCTNITDTDAEGNSALHWYIYNCKLMVTADCVKWLVEKCHINPKLVNSAGLTALQYAIVRSQDPVGKHFIQCEVVEYLKQMEKTF